MNIEETHQPRQSEQSQITYWPVRIIPTLVTSKNKLSSLCSRYGWSVYSLIKTHQVGFLVNRRPSVRLDTPFIPLYLRLNAYT